MRICYVSKATGMYHYLMGFKNYEVARMDPDRMLHVDALRTDGGLGVPCRVPFQIYPYYYYYII